MHDTAISLELAEMSVENLLSDAGDDRELVVRSLYMLTQQCRSDVDTAALICLQAALRGAADLLEAASQQAEQFDADTLHDAIDELTIKACELIAHSTGTT